MINGSTLINSEQACRRLMIEFCEYVDARDIKKLVSLFSYEGVLKRPDGLYRGQEAIQGLFDKIG